MKMPIFCSQDWNDLVHFICSSMEQSLQSSILQTLEDLRIRNIELLDTASTKSDDTVINQTETIDRRDEKQKLVSSDSESCVMKRHHKPRPVSMPPYTSPLPNDQLFSENVIDRSDCRNSYRLRHHKKCTTNKSPPVDVSLDDDCPRITASRRRASSNPHKLYFVDPRLTRLHRSSSGSSIDEMANKKTSISLDNNPSYLTLAQLKELGLSLRHEPSKTYEGQSAFSMKCWHSGEPEQSVYVRRRPKRRRSRKSAVNQKLKNSEDCPTSQKQHQFEQLCYLGPEPQPDSGRDSPTPNTIVQNSDNCATDVEDNPSHVEVKHLHQHSHHHFHHVIHHSLSQPVSVSEPLLKPIHRSSESQ